jgi:hypothetical protein
MMMKGRGMTTGVLQQVMVVPEQAVVVPKLAMVAGVVEMVTMGGGRPTGQWTS